MARKRKEEVKEEPKHVLTLDEYDVLTMDMQCLGASEERQAIVDELRREVQQLFKLNRKTGQGTNLHKEIAALEIGLNVAIRIIEGMPQYEDRCVCRECGAI
jgi:DNA segregation ATPase FtsK/SpoIIIE-like protein